MPVHIDYGGRRKGERWVNTNRTASRDRHGRGSIQFAFHQRQADGPPGKIRIRTRSRNRDSSRRRPAPQIESAIARQCPFVGGSIRAIA